MILSRYPLYPGYDKKNILASHDAQVGKKGLMSYVNSEDSD